MPPPMTAISQAAGSPRSEPLKLCDAIAGPPEVVSPPRPPAYPAAKPSRMLFNVALGRMAAVAASGLGQ